MPGTALVPHSPQPGPAGNTIVAHDNVPADLMAGLHLGANYLAWVFSSMNSIQWNMPGLAGP